MRRSGSSYIVRARTEEGLSKIAQSCHPQSAGQCTTSVKRRSW